MREMIGSFLGGFVGGFLHPQHVLPWAGDYDRAMGIVTACLIIVALVLKYLPAT